MKASFTTVTLVIMSVFIVIGGVFVYCNGGDNYQSSAEINADGMITYSLSGDTNQYRYSVFSDTSLPGKLYLYLDESYKSEFNNYYTQSEYFSVLKQMLERRGYNSIEYVDAEGLKTVMNEYDAAVFFVNGALPNTIYNGDDVLLFNTWMENGGTVFWSGPEIGRYISTKDGITDLNTGFFNRNVKEEKGFAYSESNMFSYTGMRYDDCQYGLRTNVPDSLCLAYISDDGYSSVSVAKLFNGNVTVFGGNIATTENVSQVLPDRTNCADLIICGLTYESDGLDYGKGDIRGNLTSKTSVNVSTYSDVLFFISVGQNTSEWSKSITL